MTQGVYAYSFEQHVPFDDVLSLLDLALFSVQAIHGTSGVRLDVRYHAKAQQRALVIDGGTSIGVELNRLFESHARRQFGLDGFEVTRMTRRPDDEHRDVAPGSTD